MFGLCSFVCVGLVIVSPCDLLLNLPHPFCGRTLGVLAFVDSTTITMRPV